MKILLAAIAIWAALFYFAPMPMVLFTIFALLLISLDAKPDRKPEQRITIIVE